MTRSATTQLTRRMGLSRTDIDEMRVAAHIYLSSGRLGQRVKNEDEALLLMVKARELGIPDVYALSQLYCVNGVVALQGQAMLDLVYRSKKVHVAFDGGADWASCTMTRTDGLAAPFTSRWDLERARAAGFKSPLYGNKAMAVMILRWKAVAEAARVTCPEALSGCYAVEEFNVSSLDELTPAVVNAVMQQHAEEPPVGIAGKEHLQQLYAALESVDADAALRTLRQAQQRAGKGKLKEFGLTAYTQAVSAFEHELHVRGIVPPLGPDLSIPTNTQVVAEFVGEVVPDDAPQAAPQAPARPARLPDFNADGTPIERASAPEALFPDGDLTPYPAWRNICHAQGIGLAQQVALRAQVFGSERPPQTPDEMGKLIAATEAALA